MLTLAQAKVLQPGDILLDNFDKRWKVNGQVKTWKRDASRIYVPLKHGLYKYDSISETDFTNGVCYFLTWAAVAESQKED